MALYCAVLCLAVAQLGEGRTPTIEYRGTSPEKKKAFQLMRALYAKRLESGEDAPDIVHYGMGLVPVDWDETFLEKHPFPKDFTHVLRTEGRDPKTCAAWRAEYAVEVRNFDPVPPCALEFTDVQFGKAVCALLQSASRCDSGPFTISRVGGENTLDGSIHVWVNREGVRETMEEAIYFMTEVCCVVAVAVAVAVPAEAWHQKGAAMSTDALQGFLSGRVGP